jgi:hypothetical protein
MGSQNGLHDVAENAAAAFGSARSSQSPNWGRAECPMAHHPKVGLTWQQCCDGVLGERRIGKKLPSCHVLDVTGCAKPSACCRVVMAHLFSGDISGDGSLASFPAFTQLRCDYQVSHYQSCVGTNAHLSASVLATPRSYRTQRNISALEHWCGMRLRGLGLLGLLAPR